MRSTENLSPEELSFEYWERVEAGEIDQTKVSEEDWVIDQVSMAIDRAHDSMDMER